MGLLMGIFTVEFSRAAGPLSAGPPPGAGQRDHDRESDAIDLHNKADVDRMSTFFFEIPTGYSEFCLYTVSNETFLILPASCGTNQLYLQLRVTPNRLKPMVMKID
jgi:hypothetical protein